MLTKTIGPQLNLNLSEYMKAIDLVQELVKRGIKVEIRQGEVGPEFFIGSGFYKSDGSARLVDEGDAVVLHMRYKSSVVVDNLFDIVHESYRWYDYSKDRFDGWSLPDPDWVDLYQSCGYGKMVTKTIHVWETK